MTRLLKKALLEAARLPEPEQDRLARIILDEIEDEARWSASFAQSQDELAALARAAREQIARGQVRDADPFACFREWASEADVEGYSSL